MSLRGILRHANADVLREKGGQINRYANRQIAREIHKDIYTGR